MPLNLVERFFNRFSSNQQPLLQSSQPDYKSTAGVYQSYSPSRCDCPIHSSSARSKPLSDPLAVKPEW